MTRPARSRIAGPALLLVALIPAGVLAQPMGGPGQATPPPRPAGLPPTHAAAGGESELGLQTTEPSLPANPLEVPARVARRIGSDAALAPPAPPPVVERDFYGLYYAERGPEYRFRTLFPLWMERTLPGDRASLYGMLYYNRRSARSDADVVFPFLWRLREGDTRTWIVGPGVRRTSPEGTDHWLAPLVFQGTRRDGGGYLHIPPLLTFTRHTDRSGFNLVGPLYCSWRGGPACDARSADTIDLGVAPFYFYGRDEDSEYEVIPPLLHYYRYHEVGDRSLDVWGPYIRKHDREGDSVAVLPVYFRSWGANEDHVTVFPFFHSGYEGTSRLLVTPLFMNYRGERGESAFATWGYARYRGRTELDMITPLFWSYRDPDIGLSRNLLFPLFYRNESPRSSDLVVFPLFGRFHRPSISESLWITPLFNHRTDLTGWSTSLHPVFYAGRSNHSTHLVLAPLLWDFAHPRSRTTIVAPLYWRFAGEESVSQLALNTYYREQAVRGGTEWEFHFFPAFSYGESPRGHWWNVLYGLAGYTREGSLSKVRALYIPITVSE